MIKIIIIVILFFGAFIALQILIYRTIVKNAIKKYIEPKLNEKGYSFVKYKWPGFLSNGDFENDMVTIRLTSKYGNTSNTSYAYIFYKAGNDIKKVTAKIGTSFWSIEKVSYSSEL